MTDKSPWKSTAKIETVEVPVIGKFVAGTVATVYAMTDHTDLLRRLRHGFADENYSGQVDAIMEEAADAIEALEAANAALRQDAERLDWLSAQEILIHPPVEPRVFDLRTAIDAAMLSKDKP